MTEAEVLKQVGSLKSEILGDSYKLYLYDSRSKGTNDPESDFDFLIWGKESVPEAQWQEFRLKVANLKTLYKIDLVDYHSRSRDFRSVIAPQLKEIVNGQD